MAAKKRLPDNLRRKSGQRTDAAIEALYGALDGLKREVAEGSFVGEAVSLAELMQKAGLGEKFLHGPKHKATTKPKIERELDAINKGVAAIRKKQEEQKPTAEPTDLDIAKSDAAYWKARFEKLAGQYNLAFHRIRELKRILKDKGVDTKGK